MRCLYWIFKKERMKKKSVTKSHDLPCVLFYKCHVLLLWKWFACLSSLTKSIILHTQVKNTFNTALTGYFSQLAHIYCTQTFLERPTQHCHYQYKWKWGSAKNTSSLSVYHVLCAVSFFNCKMSNKPAYVSFI